MVQRAHDMGSLVIQQVTTVQQARQAAARGVDVIIAQGGEAGGYGGMIATFTLLPQVADPIHPLPVVAAEGIADGRGLAAALVLGAAGVNVGTRFLASVEAPIALVDRRVCRPDDAGRHAREVRPRAGRHRPVPARRLPEGRGDPLQGQSPTTGPGKAAIDNLVFAITPDPSVRYQKLKAGECHVMRLSEPGRHPGDARGRRPSTCSSRRGSTSAISPSTPRRSRSTTSACARRSTWRSTSRRSSTRVFQGAGTPAKNPMPPTVWAYNDAIEDYPYDPEAAKKLLAEAGHDAGFKTDIWAMPVHPALQPQRAAHGRADPGRLEGGRASRPRSSPTSGASTSSARQAGEHETVLLGWTADNADPDNFLGVLLGCEAVGAHQPGALVPQAVRRPDQAGASGSATTAERTKLYEEAQVIFKEEAPWVTIAHSIVFQPVRKEVVDYQDRPVRRQHLLRRRPPGVTAAGRAVDPWSSPGGAARAISRSGDADPASPIRRK